MRRAKITALGALLKEIRLERGLSQRQLAAKAGVGRQAIRGWEGQATTYPEALDRIVKGLGYELDLHLLDMGSDS